MAMAINNPSTRRAKPHSLTEESAKPAVVGVVWLGLAQTRVVVEDSDEDEAEGQETESSEQRGELHSKSSSRIWRRVSMIPNSTTKPTLAK